MLGGIISALVGTFLGFLCFRYGLKGPYFALATLAFGEVIRIGVDNLDAIGGAQGLLVPLGNSSLMNFQFFEKIGYFHVIFFLTVGALVVSFFIEKCRMGAYDQLFSHVFRRHFLCAICDVYQCRLRVQYRDIDRDHSKANRGRDGQLCGGGDRSVSAGPIVGTYTRVTRGVQRGAFDQLRNSLDGNHSLYA
jgi:hypothetical protein